VPTALVTGATGLVGSHIVEQLGNDDWRIRALVRDTSARGEVSWLQAHGVELARGDILDLSSFSDAARGCDVVFHTAAAVTPPANRVHPYDAYRVPNVDGTRNAIAAAARTGARLLHLSSVAVYGPEARYATSAGVGLNEDAALDPLPDHAYYARSKRESEELVMAAHADGQIWATAVRPVVIYGPRDRQFIPRVSRLLRFGIAPAVNGGRAVMSIVHAAHVAEGAILAATSGRAGGRAYNLANDFDVTWREFYRLAGAGLGKRVRMLSVSSSVARTGLAVMKRVMNFFTRGGLNVITSASIDFMARDNPFSSERARRELGWDPQLRPETGVPDAFRWWREQAR